MSNVATVDALPPPPTQASLPTLYVHLDILSRYAGALELDCLAGWIVAAGDWTVLEVGLRIGPDRIIRCNFPFHRGDLRQLIALAGREALVGFNAFLPQRLGFQLPPTLDLVVTASRGELPERHFAISVPTETGITRRIDCGENHELSGPPDCEALPLGEIAPLLEEQTLDRLASRRRLWLRLDLINKCNLRCVMCHYSNEEFAKRPAQRLSPEEFFNFFEPIAPITREVVLSCGDEPLMSPHFEAIVREIAARDPEVRIRFCTNAMLMTEKIATAIIESNVHLVMFSFDGVTSETLHRIRVGSDYRRIIKNILYLRRLRAQRGTPNPRFVFNYVMLDSNIHEAPQFVRMARRLGADYIDFRHVVPFDYYDIEHEMLEYDQPKYNHYHRLIAATAAEVGLEVYLPPPFPTHAQHDASADPTCSLDEFHALLTSLGEPVDLELAAPHPPDDENAPIPEYAHFFCDRPFSEVMIRDQKVYPCPWHREVLGTLDGETSLEQIFFGEKFRQVRLAMLDPKGAPGCAQCPIKSDYLPVRVTQRTP